MGKVLDYLKKDRGGTNFKKIFSKIPKKFYENAGFVLILAMMAGLIAEEILWIFFGESVYIRLFYLFGACGVVFAIIYAVSVFFENQKSMQKSEYEQKKNVKKYYDKETGKVKTKESEIQNTKQETSGFIKNHIWDIMLLCMLLWSCISTVLSDDINIALRGAPFRHDGLDSYFIYGGMYVCAKAVKSDKKRIWMLRSFMITISCLSLMTLIQVNDSVVEKLGKIGENIVQYGLYQAVYLNTNHFGYVLTIGLMAMAGLVFIEKKMAAKVVALVLFAFNLWSLIINNTFGAYLGVLLGIVFLSIIMLVRDKKYYKEVIGVILIFVCVSVVMNRNNGFVTDNFSVAYKDSQNMSTNNAGGSGRIGLWKETIKCIKERPIFGFGPEGLEERLINAGCGNNRPHNEYLQHAAFLGIPGLLFYLMSLISLLVFCIKNIKKIPLIFLAIGGMVFGYCVSAFFGNTMYYTTPYYFMFLGLLSSCSEINQKESIDKQ